jgi:hypothetical protein
VACLVRKAVKQHKHTCGAAQVKPTYGVGMQRMVTRSQMVRSLMQQSGAGTLILPFEGANQVVHLSHPYSSTYRANVMCCGAVPGLRLRHRYPKVDRQVLSRVFLHAWACASAPCFQDDTWRTWTLEPALKFYSTPSTS